MKTNFITSSCLFSTNYDISLYKYNNRSTYSSPVAPGCVNKVSLNPIILSKPPSIITNTRDSTKCVTSHSFALSVPFFSSSSPPPPPPFPPHFSSPPSLSPSPSSSSSSSSSCLAEMYRPLHQIYFSTGPGEKGTLFKVLIYLQKIHFQFHSC
jgi:hypothetical protein